MSMKSRFADVMKKIANLSFSLRFSVLFVFISLFSTGMLILLASTYYRLSNNMTYTATQLMSEVSSTVYREIVDSEMLAAEFVAKSFAQLIAQDFFATQTTDALTQYIYTMLEMQSESHPVVQLISWGDNEGNVYESEKQNDGTILTQIVLRTGSSAIKINRYHDKFGNVIRETQEKTAFDPRARPWYSSAKNSQKLVWADIFAYQQASAGKLGTGVSVPVYDASGKFKGVVFVGIRLDYLEKFLSRINVSENGYVYVATDQGELIAISDNSDKGNQKFPDVSRNYVNIHQLTVPGLVGSHQHYTKTHEPEFIYSDKYEKFIASFRRLPPELPGNWLIGVVSPESDFVGELKKRNIITLMFGLFILMLGISLVSKLINWIVEPLEDVVIETEKIKEFRLEETQRITSRIKEVTRIADAIYAMKQGLRSFRKYVPAALVRQLIERGEDAKIGGTKKQLAIFFSDIRDFTQIAEKTDPNELVAHLCQYLDELARVIDASGGTIDKFIGDSIMAFWGAPTAAAFACHKAATAALNCISVSNALNAKWEQEGKSILFTRIGLHWGDAIVGNMGSSEHLNYTAISDAINMGSRLEGANKLYGSHIIVSEPVYDAIRNDFVLRLLDYVVLKGKQQAGHLYELLAQSRAEVAFDIDEYNALFQQGFTAYTHQVWDAAIQLFMQCQQIYPNDTVGQMFISRCEFFKENPPAPNWDGAWVMEGK